MTMTKTNHTSDDSIPALARSHNFVFKYRCVTADGGTAWPMEGLTVHVIWNESDPNRMRQGFNSTHCMHIGFVVLDANTVCVFRGIFSNDAKGSWWHGWQTEYMTREDARQLYAMKKREEYFVAASIVVPHNHNFI